MADSQEESYDLPHDVADLAQMIQRGQLVGLRALGDDHILYDVGTDAREDPLAHYDLETGKDVPLFPSMEAYEAEDARLAAAGDKEKRETLASWYGDPARAEMLFARAQAVSDLAANFDGMAYDLSNPDRPHALPGPAAELPAPRRPRGRAAARPPPTTSSSAACCRCPRWCAPSGTSGGSAG